MNMCVSMHCIRDCHHSQKENSELITPVFADKDIGEYWKTGSVYWIIKRDEGHTHMLLTVRKLITIGHSVFNYQFMTSTLFPSLIHTAALSGLAKQNPQSLSWYSAWFKSWSGH